MNNYNTLINLISSLKMDFSKKVLKDILCNAFSMQYNAQNPLFLEANRLKNLYYNNKVYFRGIIEISNFCKNGCYYCGINCSNNKVKRYRLSKSDIISCAEDGYKAGLRTFVLQGGEDSFFTDELLSDIISTLKTTYTDIAITLSLGERSFESYSKLRSAGADRYLLRHETATKKHYSMLHPSNLSLEHRKKCLYNLKALGFQTGAGFMVGSPYQTIDNIVSDFEFINKLKPEMVGIGPFIPHNDTLFKDKPSGNAYQTLVILSLTRIILPKVLLPATTALGALDPNLQMKALLSGANVIMPNLSPTTSRTLYSLYENKEKVLDNCNTHLPKLISQINSLGLVADLSKGNHTNF